MLPILGLIGLTPQNLRTLLRVQVLCQHVAWLSKNSDTFDTGAERCWGVRTERIIWSKINHMSIKLKEFCPNSLTDVAGSLHYVNDKFTLKILSKLPFV